MSDGLDVRIKTILEADEAASASRIKGQVGNIEKAMKSRPIKVPIEADVSNTARSVEQSVKAATSSTKGRKVVVPVEAEIQINTKDQYLKRTLIEDFRKLKAQAGSLKLDTGAFENAFNTGAFKTARQELTILEKHLRAVSAESKSALPDLAITNFSHNVGEAAALMDKLQSQLNGLAKGAPADITAKISGLRAELQKLSQIPQGAVTDADVGKYKVISTGIDDVTNALTRLKAEDKNFKIGEGLKKLDTDLLRSQQTLKNFRIDYSKAFTKPEFLQQWQGLWDTATNGSVKTRAELSALNSEISLMEKQMKGAGVASKTLWGQLTQNLQKFGMWMSAGTVFMSAVRGIRDMSEAVKAVDKSMVTLRKVTDETSATYDSFFKRASANAVKFGTTVSNMIDSVSQFSRMGYDLNTAEKLSEAANIYLNVGDNMTGIEQSTNSLIATIKGFGLAADDAIGIVDRLNNVSNKYAVESGDLGEGLRNSASALSLAGNDLDHTLAMLTAMTEVTQDASESGNALKILSMRIRGMKGKLEELGEEYENVQAVSKIQTQILNKTGVNIMSDTDPTKFKSTYDIMLGISKVYESLKQTDQASLLEILAGKHRGNSVAALLKSMSQAENVLNDSLDSTGSAYAEYSRWLDSIEAKQKQNAAAFQAFSTAIMSSDLIKGSYDAGTGILGFLTSLTEQLGSLPLLAASAAAALSFKNVGWPKTSGYRVSLPPSSERRNRVVIKIVGTHAF